MSVSRVAIRRALLSVSDKTGLIDLAKELASAGVELWSTGGSARALREAGLTVLDVGAVTGFPEIMDGRVKTLHPRIHGGLLGRVGIDDEVMTQHGIGAIDLLVVNLYPFGATIAKPTATYAEAIDNIDIGGPAMLRAAAKNHERVAVVVDPGDYSLLTSALSLAGTTLEQRQMLAAKAFAHSARYDGMVADWLGARANRPSERFGPTLHLAFERAAVLRYGENPHQSGALYLERDPPPACIAAAARLAGKELSFNNLADADAAWQCVRQFAHRPACVVVKHANPCGVALGDTLTAAYERAYATDPTSAFGGIIAFNRRLDAQTARVVLERQFVEVVIAPAVDPAALTEFARKPKVRVLACGDATLDLRPALDFKRIGGGVLVQEADHDAVTTADLRVVSRRAPTDAQRDDLLFAWKVALFVKSNAIVYARDGATLGIGAGQMSRVDSARIAGLKAAEAGLSVAGGVMASDAFFPFRDGIDAAAAAGVQAVVQPGGSMRDAEVIEAANQHGLAMVFTGIRHFRH